jgi:foldase protein PrsA
MTSAAPQRRAATPRPAEEGPSEGTSRWFLVWVALALVIGIVIGAVFMRARNARIAKEVIVSVNGANITKDVFYRRLEMGRPGNAGHSNGVNTLQSLVMDEMYVQFAKKNGVAPTDAQVQAEYAKVKKQPDFKQRMSELGLTPNEVRHNLRVSLSMSAVVQKDVQVTDAQVRKFYDMNIDPRNPYARFHTPETTRIAVIVTKTEDESKKALAELRTVKWPDVVKKYSVDKSKTVGGLLPPIQRGRTQAARVKGMEDTIFKVALGKTVGPVKMTGVWWIINCVNKEPEKTKAFEEVKDDCVVGAKIQKGLPPKARELRTAFADFVKKANVQVFWPQYKKSLTVQGTK